MTDESRRRLEPESSAGVETTLNLLVALEDRPDATQRSLAMRMGIALGLTNAYVNRAIRKGWVKVSEIPARRYLYYLTPQGFAEKARLTREYLHDSFRFFRRARANCDEIFTAIEARGGRTVALVGASDLAEIACLSAIATSIRIVAIVDAEVNAFQIAGVPVVRGLDEAGAVDAVLVTDIREPQETYDALAERLPADRLHAPAVLRIKPRRIAGPTMVMP